MYVALCVCQIVYYNRLPESFRTISTAGCSRIFCPAYICLRLDDIVIVKGENTHRNHLYPYFL